MDNIICQREDLESYIHSILNRYVERMPQLSEADVQQLSRCLRQLKKQEQHELVLESKTYQLDLDALFTVTVRCFQLKETLPTALSSLK